MCISRQSCGDHKAPYLLSIEQSQSSQLSFYYTLFFPQWFCWYWNHHKPHSVPHIAPWLLIFLLSTTIFLLGMKSIHPKWSTNQKKFGLIWIHMWWDGVPFTSDFRSISWCPMWKYPPFPHYPLLPWIHIVFIYKPNTVYQYRLCSYSTLFLGSSTHLLSISEVVLHQDFCARFIESFYISSK